MRLERRMCARANERLRAPVPQAGVARVDVDVRWVSARRPVPASTRAPLRRAKHTVVVRSFPGGQRWAAWGPPLFACFRLFVPAH